MIRIDRHTTNEGVAPFVELFSDEQRKAIKDAAVRDRFGDAGFYGLTVGQLTTVLSGDPRPLFDSGGRTVFDMARVTAFSEWLDEFIGTLGRLTLPPTAEGMTLQSGTLKSTFEESVYTFCRSYFNLASFEACDRLKVSELLLAKKDDYNRAVVDRNVSRAIRKGGRA